MRPVTKNNVELSVELDMDALPVDASDVLLRLLQVIHDSYGVNAQSAAVVYPPLDDRAPDQSGARSRPFRAAPVRKLRAAPVRKLRAAPVRKRTAQNRYGVSGNGTGQQYLPDLWEQLDIGRRGIAAAKAQSPGRGL